MYCIENVFHFVEVITSTPKLSKSERTGTADIQMTHLSKGHDNEINENSLHYGHNRSVDNHEVQDTVSREHTQKLNTFQQFDDLEPPSFLAENSDLDFENVKLVPPLNLTEDGSNTEKIDTQEKELHDSSDTHSYNLPKGNVQKVSTVFTPDIHAHELKKLEIKSGGRQSPCLTPVIQDIASKVKSGMLGLKIK